MSRQIINTIQCAHCHKEFAVATEDLEWEHISDIGETDDDSSIHDFAIHQSVVCPHCGKSNKILAKMRGTTPATIDFSSLEVISMELGAYLD